MKACSLCSQVYDDEKVCSKCGIDLSEKFSGMIILLNPEKSEVSAVIGKDKEGKYAIKVR